ncbi:hypothetical protein HN807_09275 [Candidatus Bathyarchaeota archaeon]|nr:hypothetical protein [Candidatus Bathyarchaeota archaeon]MBT4320978.1 hypothetical protein [Candidatus Bathyarchaeota archaeon]MBT4424473.1 hypothetical protein [Candidatus Bathyarchaeota archaeon]MBT6603711.1 hypothetical protein [Candidatus Bathyarchaeota archaeon]MBT7187931.1 hypothetical protein [Candidatus Bathyarchaeota archaeon]
MIETERVLLLISSTLFLNYLGGMFYKRTKIPDIVWLLVFGMVLGPILKFFDAALFLDIFDLMLLVTVALFAFNMGLNFNIQHLLGNTARAFNMAIMSFLVTTITVGLALSVVLPKYFNFVNGLLLGAMIGGMDGVSIRGLINSLGAESKEMGVSGAFLKLESTLADPIKVVGVVTIIKMVTIAGAGPQSAARDILFSLTTAALIGIGAGLTWGEFISRLGDRPLNYMLTIAALFPVYVFAEIISGGGGGPISAFLFGVVLMNYAFVTRSLNMKRRSRIDRRKIREYHDEISFLVKALFFVYLGLIVRLNPAYIAVGGFLTALIIVVRFLTATLMGNLQGFPDEQVIYTRYFFIQGAGSLVLSQFVTKYDPNSVFFPGSEVFTNLMVPIVLISIVFTSVVAPVLARKQTMAEIHVIDEGLDPEEPEKLGKNGEKS